jgi:hypothetical protein
VELFCAAAHFGAVVGSVTELEQAAVATARARMA